MGRKSGVKKSQIKSKEKRKTKKSKSSRDSDDDDSSDNEDSLSRGDKVEAKCTGWTKYYSGEITKVNRDGTYDIRFDDGERKSGVKKSQIKSKKKSRDNKSSSSSRRGRDNDESDVDSDDDRYTRGDSVEAKVSGWTKYYSGEITRVNRDGTYDIKFDDGERKSGVKSSQ